MRVEEARNDEGDEGHALQARVAGVDWPQKCISTTDLVACTNPAGKSCRATFAEHAVFGSSRRDDPHGSIRSLERDRFATGAGAHRAPDSPIDLVGHGMDGAVEA